MKMYTWTARYRDGIMEGKALLMPIPVVMEGYTWGHTSYGWSPRELRRPPMSDSVLIMPWGKFKGQAIETIPNWYVRWLAENCKDERICKLADTEMAFREKWDIDVWED